MTLTRRYSACCDPRTTCLTVNTTRFVSLETGKSFEVHRNSFLFHAPAFSANPGLYTLLQFLSSSCYPSNTVKYYSTVASSLHIIHCLTSLIHCCSPSTGPLFIPVIPLPIFSELPFFSRANTPTHRGYLSKWNVCFEKTHPIPFCPV